MKRFALICTLVVAVAAATWAASTTEKVVPLKTMTSGTSFPAMLNDLQQQAAAKSSQGSPRVTWQSLLSTAQVNRTSSSIPAVDLSNVSGGRAVPRVLTLQGQIDVVEGQIDQALVRHEDPASLYIELNDLYAQRPPETDLPSVEGLDGAHNGSHYYNHGNDNVPVACGGDTCGSATTITSLPYCITCNTANAHNDYQPTCLAVPSGPDVVFKYRPTTNQLVSVSLCGSSFNTVLSIYDGCPVAGAAPLCCNDDGCGPNNLQSCCPGLQLQGGHTYYIIVDGATATSFGQFVLHVTLGNVCASAPCVSNDHCPYPNREVDANDGCGEPDLPTLACGDTVCGEIRPNGDRDWYRIVIPQNTCRVLAIDVFGNDTPGYFPFGRGLDPRVSLYGSDCTTLIGSDDNSGVGYDSRLVTDCLPAGVYFIRVVGVEGSTGPYVLAITCRACDCPLRPCVECPANAIQEDEGCTPNSGSINGGCFDTPQQFGEIQCGEYLCGTLWERAVENQFTRDTDWYRFILESRDSVRFTVKANMPYVAYVLQTVGALAPCDSFAVFASGIGDTCETITVAACLPPGTYYFFVAPRPGHVFNCAHYLVHMECLPCSERPSCITCPENARHEEEPCPNVPDNFNGGCNTREPHFSQIGCNDVVCGTSFAGLSPAGNQIIDQDWYRLNLEQGESLRVCVRADFRAVFALFWAGFNPPCDTSSSQVLAYGVADSCGEISCLAACLPAGVYYLALAPLQVTDCGHYVIRTQCLPCSHGCVVCPENIPHEEEACLSYPDMTNGGCITRGEVRHFSRIECNSAICGTSWFLPARNDSSTPLFDTDWYLFNLDEPDSVTFLLRSDFPAILGIGYFRNGVVNCDSLSLVRPAEVAPCQSYEVGACLPPGRYVLVVLPDFTIPSLPPILCGHYLLGVFCHPCERPCALCPPNAGIEVESCSPTAPNINGGCESPPGTAPLFGHIKCDSTICGTSWEILGPNGGYLRDSDWFQFSVTQARDSIVFSYSADFATAAVIYRPSSAAPCPGEEVWSGVIDSCEHTLFGLCLTPGLYSVVIRPAYGHVFECGHYVLNMQCLECTPCPEVWAVDGYDLGDLTPCYPTQAMNPAHGISHIAWLGQTITAETTPTVGDDDTPNGDDGVQYLHLPWTPCAMETVIVTVMGGSRYERYAGCGGHLFLNGWKDGNLDGDFCDTMWCGGLAARILADEWIVQDMPVTPGVYTLPVRDPGVFDRGIYNGVFRWRLTSRPVGRNGFGQATTQCNTQQCGNFAVDFLGEVEDYILHDAQLDVSLTSFVAVAGDGQVTLRWVTASETGNDYFRIMRNNNELARVATQGNGADRHTYTYTDDRAANGAMYTYTLVAIDQTGGGSVLETVTAAPSPGLATVTEYALKQNYPNPFNPTTTITFDLVDGGFVSLKVYNLVGQVVATVVNGNMAKGEQRVSFDAANLPTGIYVYRLEVNGFTAARKMLLTK